MSRKHPLPRRPKPYDNPLASSSTTSSSYPVAPSASLRKFVPYQPLGASYHIPTDIVIDLDDDGDEPGPVAGPSTLPKVPIGISATANATAVLEEAVRRNGKTAGHRKVKMIKEQQDGRKKKRSIIPSISRAWLSALKPKDKPGGRDKINRILLKLRDSPLPINVTRLPPLLVISNEFLSATVFKPFLDDGSRSEKHRWLEWQGDAHLNAFITDKLVEDYANISISQADKLRNYMRSNVIFAHMATHYEFPSKVPSFQSRTNETPMKPLADVFEAYVGALQKVAKGDHAKEAILAAWLHKVFGAKVFPDMEKFVKVIEVDDSSDEEDERGKEEDEGEGSFEQDERESPEQNEREESEQDERETRGYSHDDEEEADMELDYDTEIENNGVIDLC